MVHVDGTAGRGEHPSLSRSAAVASPLADGDDKPPLSQLSPPCAEKLTLSRLNHSARLWNFNSLSICPDSRITSRQAHPTTFSGIPLRNLLLHPHGSPAHRNPKNYSVAHRLHLGAQSTGL